MPFWYWAIESSNLGGAAISQLRQRRAASQLENEMILTTKDGKAEEEKTFQ
jgi:hypothetical protein